MLYEVITGDDRPLGAHDRHIFHQRLVGDDDGSGVDRGMPGDSLQGAGKIHQFADVVNLFDLLFEVGAVKFVLRGEGISYNFV